ARRDGRSRGARLQCASRSPRRRSGERFEEAPEGDEERQAPERRRRIRREPQEQRRLSAYGGPMGRWQVREVVRIAKDSGRLQAPLCLRILGDAPYGATIPYRSSGLQSVGEAAARGDQDQDARDEGRL